MTGGSIAVLGAGIVCPAGNNSGRLLENLREGRSLASPLVFDELSGWSGLACRLSDFDPLLKFQRHELRRMDVPHQMALWAADDALMSIANRPSADRCAVVVGAGFGAPGWSEVQCRALIERGLRAVSPLTIPVVMSNSVAAFLSLRYGFTGPALTVGTACASGVNAIGEAMWLLRTGRADLVLAGGVDAMVTPAVTGFFARMEAMSSNPDPALASRPFDVDRDGFVLSEGAGFVVLTREKDAVGSERVGLLLGYGAGSDAFHLVAPPEDGAGAAACMRLALADAGIGPSDVGHINAHGTSTPRNDLAEATAISTVFGDSSPPVTAPKGVTGHMVGGSGAVETIATLLSAQHRMVPPVGGLRNLDPAINIDVVIGEPRTITNPVGLTNSFGFGGHNASLVVTA